MKTLKTALLLCMATAFCACSGLQQGIFWRGETVEGTGLAHYDEKNLVQTKANSLTAAQRNAVEQVVGVFVSADTMTEQAVTINNRILTKTEGFIKKYRVIEEGREGNYYRTKIEAFVLVDDVSKAVSSLPVSEKQDAKNTMVAGALTLEGSQPFHVQDAQNEISRLLRDSGINLISSGNVRSGSAIDDISDLIRAARNTDSKYLVVYGGSAYKVENSATAAGGFASYRAKIDIQLISLANGNTVYENSASASAVDVSPKIAAGKALGKAAAVAAETLADQIKKADSAGEEIELELLSISSLAQMQQIQALVEGTRGVERQRIKSYSGGDLTLQVKLQNVSLEEFIMSLLTKPIKFEVQRMEPFKAQLRVRD